MKRCSICDEEKELSEFAIIRPKKSGGFTYATRCKNCHSKLAWEAKKKDPAKLEADRKRVKEWADKNRESLREKAKERWARVKDSKNKGRTKKTTCSQCGAPERKRDGLCSICAVERDSKRYQNNKAYSREAVRKRALKRKEVGGNHTLSEWKALKAQYDHKCLCCGKSEPQVELTRDHVIAITKGGTDDIENIQPLCRSCNAKKQTSQIDFRK